MINVEKNKNLALLNTLAVSVTAEYYCCVHTLEELQEAAEYAREHRLAITLLGGGSNVVFAQNVNGIVIHIAICGIQPTESLKDEVLINVGAGQNWHQLVEYSLQNDWYGLENLALIPGLAGAAPIQNIGAYGVELRDVFSSLQAVDLNTGAIITMNQRDCEFGYRDSAFKHQYRDLLAITSLQLRLSKTAKLRLYYPALQSAIDSEADVGELTPSKVAEIVCKVRRSKLPDPLHIPNAGSFFKNPVVTAEKARVLCRAFAGLVSYPQPDGNAKLAAGWLIDQCGWRGKRKGNVGVHEQQALVLVNHGGTGAELLALAAEIAESVKNRYGVDLEIEPRVYC